MTVRCPLTQRDFDESPALVVGFIVDLTVIRLASRVLTGLHEHAVELSCRELAKAMAEVDREVTQYVQITACNLIGWAYRIAEQSTGPVPSAKKVTAIEPDPGSRLHRFGVRRGPGIALPTAMASYPASLSRTRSTSHSCPPFPPVAGP